MQSYNETQLLQHFTLPTNDYDMPYSPASTDSSSVPVSFTALTKSSGERLSSDRECVLFPTYAMRNPQDNNEWIVQTKGWALSHNISVAKQKLAMGVTKNFVGEGSADRPSSDRFEQRFKYFLAKNKRNKEFTIEAVGAISIEQILDFYVEEDAAYEDGDIADVSAAALGPVFTPSVARRSSAESNDSGFQSSPTDDDNEKLTDDFCDDYPLPMVDLVRPGNPVSTVLDGNRRPYTPSMRSSYSSDSIPDELDCHFTVGSPESASSASYAEEQSHATTSRPYSINVKTEGSGFLNGEMAIPHSRILSWAKEQDHCNARIIRLQSSAHTFSPSQGHVSLVEPTGISIISDIDDTIKDTQILAGARTVLSNTFFKNACDVSGMADVYMDWYNQGAAFHYVSNSPFQLMPMLDRFLKSSEFPPGSMHLRLDGSLLARLVEVPGRAKRDAILQIIKDFPQRQFVLIGDSGEIDLEIYARIGAEYPEQVLKIFIRDVSSKKVELARRNTLTSIFTPTKKQQPERPPNSTNSADLGSRRAVTLGDMSSASSASMQSRVAKAKQYCKVDIVVFKDAEVLRKDVDIGSALWKSLDDQASATPP